MSPFFTSGSQNVRVSASASEKAMVMNVLSEIKVERSFKKIIDHNQDLSPNRFYFQPKTHTHTHTHTHTLTPFVQEEFSEDFMNPTEQGPFPFLHAAHPNLLHLFHNTTLSWSEFRVLHLLVPCLRSQQCQPCSAAESDLLQSKKKKIKNRKLPFSKLEPLLESGNVEAEPALRLPT